MADAWLRRHQLSGRITSTGPTAEVEARLDQAQAAVREGPCVTAVDPDATGHAKATFATSALGAAAGAAVRGQAAPSLELAVSQPMLSGSTPTLRFLDR